jgi:hypothetical protein
LFYEPEEVLPEPKPEPAFVPLDKGDVVTFVLGLGDSLTVDGADVAGLVNVTLPAGFVFAAFATKKLHRKRTFISVIV